MKVAIYMNKPQLCGPGTWCNTLRYGFRRLAEARPELNLSCEVITSTKSGKWRSAFGRIEQFKGSDASCSLVPDLVVRDDKLWQLMDEYDLIVLDQIKCAYADKQAEKNGDDPWYVEVLSMTKTPFCSALHGRYYWEPHETPKNRRAINGTPFVRDLLTLSNFTGYLMDHARDFDINCEILRKLAPAKQRSKMALPYYLNCSEQEALSTENRKYTIGCNGRVTGAKNRGLIQHALVELCSTDRPISGAKIQLPQSVVYRGISSITSSACESYLMYYWLHKEGFRGWREETNAETGLGPVQRCLPWWQEKGPLRIEFNGAFTRVINGFGDMQIHLSITDCGFSGGLLEFSTLEAMDAGVLPIVTTPFLPDYPLTTGPFGSVDDPSVGAPPGVFELPIAVEFGESQRYWEEHGEELKEKLAAVLVKAQNAYHDPALRQELVLANRAWIKEHCDPRKHAAAILEGVERCREDAA